MAEAADAACILVSGAWAMMPWPDIHMPARHLGCPRWLVEPGGGEPMHSKDELAGILANWDVLVGEAPAIGDAYSDRELWPVTATDGQRYFLKRLGPWRNLPLSSEYRVQMYLRNHGFPVADYQVTRDARLYAGPIEDSYVLMARLPEDDNRSRLPGEEIGVGAAVARMHAILKTFPWATGSYEEDMVAPLEGDLYLPSSLTADYTSIRSELIDALDALPAQTIHGDLTPDNVLWHRGHLAGVIDLDHLPAGPRLWDISKYVNRVLSSNGAEASTAARDHQFELARSFIRGYITENPLSERELAAIPAGAIAAGLIDIDYTRLILDGKLDRRRPDDLQEQVDRAVAGMHWQLNNMKALQAIVPHPATRPADTR
jgi:Ser/Thr protein kinase RdoA (MazF antagonist)